MDRKSGTNSQMSQIVLDIISSRGIISTLGISETCEESNVRSACTIRNKYI